MSFSLGKQKLFVISRCPQSSILHYTVEPQYNKRPRPGKISLLQ